MQYTVYPSSDAMYIVLVSPDYRVARPTNASED